MKLLLDENLSRRVVPFLQEAYPGSSQVALLGLETATDQQVWDYARHNGHVIVSRDSDFYDLSLLQGTPPQVISIKTGNASKVAITELLLSNHARILSMLLQEYMACIELY